MQKIMWNCGFKSTNCVWKGSEYQNTDGGLECMWYSMGKRYTGRILVKKTRWTFENENNKIIKAMVI